MAISVAEFPRKQYGGAYFELFHHENGEVTARVYLKAGPAEFTGTKARAEAFIRAKMAKAKEA